MKKLVALLFVFLLVTSSVNAQMTLTPGTRPHKGFATQILNSIGIDHIDISKWPFRAVAAGTAIDNSNVFNLIQNYFPGMPIYVPPSISCFGANNVTLQNFANIYGATGVTYSQLSTLRSCITAAAGATTVLNPNGNISQELTDVEVICDTAGGTGNAIKGIAGGSTNMHMVGGAVRFCGNGGLGDTSNITHTFQSFGTVYYGNGNTNTTANVENMVDSQFYGGYNVQGYYGWDFPAGANSNQIIGVKTEFDNAFGYNFQNTTKDNVVIGGVCDNNTFGCMSIGSVTSLTVTGIDMKRNGRGAGGTFTGTGTYGQNAQIYMNGGATNVIFSGVMTHTGVNDNGSGTLGPPYAILFNAGTDKFVTIGNSDFTGNVSGPVLFNSTTSPSLMVSNVQGWYPVPRQGEDDLTGVITLSQVATAAAPTIANVGTGGAVTWTYKVVACSAPNYCSPASAGGSTTTGNATLTTSNYNTITVVPVRGAMYYDVYRTVAGTTPSTTGKIGTIYGQDLVLNDTALAGNAATAPSTNTTGYFLQGSASVLAASVAPFQNTLSASGALSKNAYFQNSAGGGGSAACITFGTYTTWTVAEPISICGADNNFSNDFLIKQKATGANNGSDTETFRLLANNQGLKTTQPLIDTGTKFTTTGCSISSTTGGASVGKFTLGANTCTAVITIGGATGSTAPNGWDCEAHDYTSNLIAIEQSSSTTTTASINIPATAGATDVIGFQCRGF